MKSFLKYSLLILSLSGLNTVSAQNDIEVGKTIFNSRCASCHAVGKKLVGPALQNVEERHSAEWIVDFVRHSQQLVQSGDKEAVAVYEEYNKTIMPDHLDLKESDIKNILVYIKEETIKLTDTPATRVPDLYKPYKGKSSIWHQIVYLDIPGNHTPVTKNDKQFWGLLGVFIAAVVLLFYGIVKGNELIDKIGKKFSTDNSEK